MESALSDASEDLHRAFEFSPAAGVGVLLGLGPVAGSPLHRPVWADGIVDVEENELEAARCAWDRIFPDGMPEMLS